MTTSAGQQIASQANSNVNKIVFGTILYNAKAYGAKGDGVADDTTHIQATINAAHTAGGGIVFIPPGIYIKSAGLVLYSNIVLQGAGKDVTILKTKNNAGSTISVGLSNFSTNVCIKDLTIEGNKTNQTVGNYGFLAYKCNNIIIENVKIIRQNGIGMGFSNTYNVKIISCEASYSGVNQPGVWCGFDDVAPYNTGFVFIDDLDAHYNDLDGVIFNVPNSTVQNSRMTYNGQAPLGGALGAAGIYNDTMQENTKILNNYFAYNTEFGINGIFKNTLIEGNTSTLHGLSGMNIRNTSNRVTVSNNFCNFNGNNPTTGNPNLWGKSGIQFDKCTFLKFIGNTCIDNRADDTQEMGLQCMNTGNSNWILISDNQFKFNVSQEYNMGVGFPSVDVTNLTLGVNI